MSTSENKPDTTEQQQDSSNTTNSTPLPQHLYPHRKIFFPNDLPQLYWSDWFVHTMEFLLKMNIHLRAKTLQDINFEEIPPQYIRLTTLLNKLRTEIDRYPPYHQNQRFGNTAFREWFDPVQGLVTEAMQDMVNLVGKDDEGYCPEIGVMLGDFRESLQMHLNWKNGAKLAVQSQPLNTINQNQQQTSIGEAQEVVHTVFRKKRAAAAAAAALAASPNSQSINIQPIPLNFENQQQQIDPINFTHQNDPRFSPSFHSHNSISTSSTTSMMQQQHQRHDSGANYREDDLPPPIPLTVTKPHVGQRANQLTQHLRPPSQSPSTTPRPIPQIPPPELGLTSQLSLGATGQQVNEPTDDSSQQDVVNTVDSAQKTTPCLVSSTVSATSASSTTSATSTISISELSRVSASSSIAASVLPSLSAASYSNPGELSADQQISLPCSLSQELTGYFLETLGNYIRIDYGTGHELAFITFLTALEKSGVFPLKTQNESIYVALVIFDAYLNLVRRLQSIYWLEPAGSKGAWGLDDYQFICFLWGSSQFIGLKESKGLNNLPPISAIFNTPPLHDKLSTFGPTDFITDPLNDYDDNGDEFTASYMAVDEQNIENTPIHDKRGLLLVDALKFVHLTKPVASLQNSSPILYSLSQMQSWEVINQTLLRMYGAEVIAKFPVMQHVKFGAILPCNGVQNYEKFKPQQQNQQNQQNRGLINSEISTQWYINTGKLHNLLRIPPTILDINNEHQRNVKMDAALIVRKK